MTPADLVVVLLIANAVQNAMVGPDTTLQGGLVVAWARVRWPALGPLVEGKPLHHAEWVDENLRKEHLTLETAVLEVDGTVSVAPRGVDVHRTTSKLKNRGA